ncbi:hypothetical protein [Pseudomonas sp. 9AZ]|uniref:hypothetical protein n=1 Tax=Pseudomonas sp. 9AZ TaxID=2653168 RepID=UPI00135A7468|nr:hypothetical protein [Pseudomonas sp. 9AZ]
MTDRIQNDSWCGVCGRSTQVPGYGEQFGTLSARWGYGSRHDGEHYRVTLCEGCFFGALLYLREQRWIQTMFDEAQPTDDGGFGLIARDDYFGES